MDYIHEPVLVNEVLELLDIQPNENIVDGTLGAGGHSQQMLQKNGPDGKLLGIDLDEDALVRARHRLADEERSVLVRGSYEQMAELAAENQIAPVHKILLDLGISSMHIEVSGRGFSFLRDEPLDMRFGGDFENKMTAAEIIARYTEKDLARIIRDYGEEKLAKRIARKICLRRKDDPFKTTQQLVHVIRAAMPAKLLHKPTHFATRTFQALRIEVNKEFEVIERSLQNAVDLLETGGRLAVITFHSLEDTVVKRTFKKMTQGCICPPQLPLCRCSNEPQIKLVNRKVVMPTPEEIEKNKRSRSAKLRVIEKI